MAGFQAIAGQKIFIGGKLASDKDDMVADDFSSQVWVEIDGWVEKGEIGDEAELIEETVINRGRVMKIKGSRNAGSMENVFLRLDDDPGQIAFRAAEKSGDEYAFKIEGTGTTPPQELFVGLAMSVRNEGGDADTADRVNMTVEITSNIVSVL